MRNLAIVMKYDGCGDNKTDITGRELIKWILDNKAENLPIRIQYRDSGGDYDGVDRELRLIKATEEDTDEYRWQRDILIL